jgi:hypothetical protein
MSLIASSRRVTTWCMICVAQVVTLLKPKPDSSSLLPTSTAMALEQFEWMVVCGALVAFAMAFGIGTFSAPHAATLLCPGFSQWIELALPEQGHPPPYCTASVGLPWGSGAQCVQWDHIHHQVLSAPSYATPGSLTPLTAHNIILIGCNCIYQAVNEDRSTNPSSLSSRMPQSCPNHVNHNAGAACSTLCSITPQTIEVRMLHYRCQ